MRIILASASPRRSELLKTVIDGFIVDPARIDETIPEEVQGEFAPVFLAAEKAEALAAKYPDDLICAADTAVFCDGEMLGKPRDPEDAKRILRFLSGKTHKVITGCCLRKGQDSVTFSEETAVTFYPLTDEEICAYIATGEPLDKAGAYGIQGKGALLIRSIDGDYYNVVGLPIARLKREMDAFLA